MANLAYGEEDFTLLKQILRLAIKAAIIAVGAVALILFIVAPWVSMLYSQDPEVLAMATTAIHFYAISMPIYALVQVVQNFCQATKKVTLAMFICVLDNFLLIILPAIILPNYFGINGIWMSFIACEILMILIYTVIVMIRKKSAKIKLDDFLLLTKEYDEMESNNFEYTIQDSEGVMMSSIGTEAFCMKNGIDDKRTNAVALCIEEMGANVVKNGIKGNKKQYVDIKVIIRGDDIVIRLRDNCTDFNPVEHHKTNADDPFAGIGIKMVFKMAKDVNYIMTMNLNNLVITI